MSWRSVCVLVCVCAVSRTQVIPGKARTNDGDYNSVNTDGSFDFGYKNPDVGGSYHLARGGAGGAVGGRFGARDPATGSVRETVYTAGPRGFRAKGPNIHRKMDLSQIPRGPIGTKDDPYADPSEDPSYDFKVNTRTYSKSESADGRGDVKGHYTYLDDIGERHDVSYVAGRDTGFVVTSAVPDDPRRIGAPWHRAPLVRGEARPRGRSAVQRGADGSYRFISAGPDQRRTESSDSRGNVRGSYSFLDDKGVQRTVHYIAGPGIGYRIVKSGQDPHIPAYFPTVPSAYDPDFADARAGVYSADDVVATDDVFKGPDGTAASGHVKPPAYPSDIDKPAKKPGRGSARPKPTPGVKPPLAPPDEDSGETAAADSSEDVFEPTSKPGRRPTRPPTKPYRPAKKPYVPLKPLGKEGGSQGPEYAIGFNINESQPSARKGAGTTIIRNIGDEYLGIPPGVSVRAHVQSIDLYPYNAKPLSPSEALENDKSIKR